MTVETGRKITSILLQEIQGMMEGRNRRSEQLPVLHLSLVIHVSAVVFTSLSVPQEEMTTKQSQIVSDLSRQRESKTQGNTVTCFTFYFYIIVCSCSLHTVH